MLEQPKHFEHGRIRGEVVANPSRLANPKNLLFRVPLAENWLENWFCEVQGFLTKVPNFYQHSHGRCLQAMFQTEAVSDTDRDYPGRVLCGRDGRVSFLLPVLENLVHKSIDCQ